LAFHAGGVVLSVAASATWHTRHDVDSVERGRLTVLSLRNPVGSALGSNPCYVDYRCLEGVEN